MLSILLPLQVIKVYNEDNTSRAIEVPNDITARDICQMFVLKNNCIDDHSWTLFEQLSLLGIGEMLSLIYILQLHHNCAATKPYFHSNSLQHNRTYHIELKYVLDNRI